MKKTLVSALTTALVVGAASTTFAAANPFADVPAGHWAYDAVTELASKGIVDGYAVDGTFKGDQTMTRYEMAQIVAKAMAKIQVPAATNTTVINGADKAMVEKLSAEFSDELANLGVRVKDLESKVDNVKFSGFVRYEYKNRRTGGENTGTKQRVIFRLTPTMKVNDQWTAHARMEYSMDANAASVASGGSVAADSYNATYSKIDQAWVDGNVGTVQVKAGRFGVWSAADHGLTFDDTITGGQVTIPLSKEISFDAAVGRYNWTPVGGFVEVKDKDGNVKKVLAANASEGYAKYGWTYAGAELTYAKGKLDAGIAYRTWKGGTDASDGMYRNIKTLSAGAGYQFGSVYATVDYARATSEATGAVDDNNKNTYNVQLNWQATQKVGLYVAYKKLSDSVVCSTYDLQTYSGGGQKGWEIGTNISLQKNVSACAYYFDGKQAYGAGKDTKDKMFYGNITFKF